jgi:protease I
MHFKSEQRTSNQEDEMRPMPAIWHIFTAYSSTRPPVPQRLATHEPGTDSYSIGKGNGAVIMSGELNGRRIAILATDGFEQVELTEPKKNLEAAGAKTEVLSVKDGEIKGWKFTDWGDSVKVDKLVSKAKVDDYDLLVLPGGQINPDKLRMEPDAVAFVREFAQSGKLVAAICHAPWMLIEAGVVKGRTMTSWPSVRTDLKNAGANVVDQPVVVDGNFITSRKPDDIPAFSQKIIEEAGSKKQLRAAS